MLTTLIYFSILAGIWAFGEAISVKTKAIISTVFTAMLIMLLVTWAGWLPTDAVAQSGMGQIAPLCIPLMLVSMGTTLSLKQLKEEWKTIAICLGGLVTLLLGTFFIVRFILGFEQAVVAGSVVYGGGVANVIIAEKTTAIGRADLTALNWLMGSLQAFVGVPMSLFCLKLFLKRTIKNNRVHILADPLPDDPAKSSTSAQTCLIPEKYQSPFVLLFLTAAVATAGYFIGNYTDRYLYLHPYIVCLVFGFLLTKCRILPQGILKKAGADGFMTFAMFIFITGSMIASVSYEVFLELIGPMLIAFAVLTPCLSIGAYVTAKALKIDPILGIALAASCMFGYPTTIILAQEAARALGRNAEEARQFENYLVPKMLIAGLFTISLTSGVVASVMMGLL